MVDYEIPLYMTCDAYEKYGAELRNNVKKYIEHFVGQVGKSASVILPDYHVYVPTQNPYQSFYHIDVLEWGHYFDRGGLKVDCDGIHTWRLGPMLLRQYSSLGAYLHHFTEEYSDRVPYSKDGVLLLTSYDSGGEILDWVRRSRTAGWRGRNRWGRISPGSSQ